MKSRILATVLAFGALSFSFGCSSKDANALGEVFCAPETGKLLQVKINKAKYSSADKSMQIYLVPGTPMTDVVLDVRIVRKLTSQVVFKSTQKFSTFDQQRNVSWNFLRSDVHKFAADGEYRVVVEGRGTVNIKRNICVMTNFELDRR